MLIEVLKAEGFIKNGSFNFEALNEKLRKDQEIDFLIEMSFEEQVLLFKLLFENKRYDIIAKTLEHKNLQTLEITPLAKLYLVQALGKSNELSYKELKKNIEKLNISSAILLRPYQKNLTTEEVKKLEQSIFTLKSKAQKFKTELMDQIQFLKNQQLFDKDWNFTFLKRLKK